MTDPHQTVGQARITKRLEFWCKGPPLYGVRSIGEYEYLEVGEIVPVLHPDESDMKDFRDREKHHRPGLVVIRWREKVRLVPMDSVELKKELSR